MSSTGEHIVQAAAAHGHPASRPEDDSALQGTQQQQVLDDVRAAEQAVDSRAAARSATGPADRCGPPWPAAGSRRRWPRGPGGLAGGQLGRHQRRLDLGVAAALSPPGPLPQVPSASRIWTEKSSLVDLFPAGSRLRRVGGGSPTLAAGGQPGARAPLAKRRMLSRSQPSSNPWQKAATETVTGAQAVDRGRKPGSAAPRRPHPVMPSTPLGTFLPSTMATARLRPAAPRLPGGARTCDVTSHSSLLPIAHRRRPNVRTCSDSACC